MSILSPFPVRPASLLLRLVALLLALHLIPSPVSAQTFKTVAIGGHIFELSLQVNTGLFEKLIVADTINPDGEYFRGVVVDQPGSWTRLSRIEGQWRGVISVGGQVFILDEAVSSTGELSTHPAAQAQLADFSATSIDEFEPQACGVQEQNHSVAQASQSDSESASAFTVAQPAQYSSLCSTVINGICMIAELEFAFDQQFQSEMGANASAEATALVNIVEGFYQNDFNIAFEALSMEFLTSEVVSSTTNAGDLLDDIRTKKNSGAFNFIENPQALFHFVTGRELDGGTAGIAYMSALCSSNWGIGLTQLLSNTTITAVVMAHELGHNFGASHDGDGNSCGNGFIMQSTVNSSIDEFSSCSINAIIDELESLNNPAQCFNFAVDAAVSASASNPAQVNANQQFTAQYTISTSSGYEAISGLEVTGSVPASEGQFDSVTLNGQSCSVNGNGLSYSCTLNNPDTSAVLEVNATPTDSSINLTHTVTVTGSGDVRDVDASNDQLVSSFSVMAGSVPDAPSSLTANASGTQVNLSWQDNSDNESGFRIERRIAGGTFSEIAQVSANSVSYTDTMAVVGTAYEYRVFAFNTAGDSNASNIAQASIEETPQPPTGLGASQVSGSLNVALSWTDNADNESGYSLERRVGSNAFTVLATLSANSSEFTDTSTQAQTTYEYRVRAFNLSGNSAWSNTAQVTVDPVPVPDPPPAAPANLVASEGPNNAVDLVWEDRSDNETGFLLERSVNGGAYTAISQLSTNSETWTDQETAAGNQYQYRLTAFNGSGNSPAIESNTIDIADAPPQQPTNLVVTQGSGSTVNLSWQDNSNNESGFIIQRREVEPAAANVARAETARAEFTEIARVAANVTSYADQTNAENATFAYEVIAFNASGASAPAAAPQITVSPDTTVSTTPSSSGGGGGGGNMGWLSLLLALCSVPRRPLSPGQSPGLIAGWIRQVRWSAE